MDNFDCHIIRLIGTLRYLTSDGFNLQEYRITCHQHHLILAQYNRDHQAHYLLHQHRLQRLDDSPLIFQDPYF